MTGFREDESMRLASWIVTISTSSYLMWGCGGGAPAAPSASSASGATETVSTTTTTTTPAATTTTSVPVPRIRRRASFTSANGYQTAGRAQVVMEGGDFTLELLSDFRTSQSAALDVRLCQNVNCRGSQWDLGGLRSFSGAQSYSLPDLGREFSHVVIYCRAVRLAFGSGVFQ